MGVVPIVLVILAMKIPIVGLLWLVWWASREPRAEGPSEDPVRDRKPLRPRPTPSGRPRRGGTHGGGASLPAPARRRGLEPHPAAPQLAASSQRKVSSCE